MGRKNLVPKKPVREEKGKFTLVAEFKPIAAKKDEAQNALQTLEKSMAQIGSLCDLCSLPPVPTKKTEEPKSGEKAEEKMKETAAKPEEEKGKTTKPQGVETKKEEAKPGDVVKAPGDEKTKANKSPKKADK